MIIYPAIDIIDAKCVRLTQGDYDKVDVYDKNPVNVAKKWKAKKAQYLHIIDLDGARAKKPINLEIAKKIAKLVDLPIQLGGGIRTMEDIEKCLSYNVSRVILGTSAVKNPEFIKKAVLKYGDKIVISVDAKDGRVAIDGWEELSNKDAVLFAKLMQSIGVKTIIYTDISRDGMLMGPNYKGIKKIKEALDIDLVAAGGVTSIENIVKLNEIGISGAVIGKALYTGNIDLEEAIEIGKG